jgi:hypothetical protein
MTVHPMPATHAEAAIHFLRHALKLLRHGNHPKAARRVRLALSSAYGARRMAEYRETRSQA